MEAILWIDAYDTMQEIVSLFSDLHDDDQVNEMALDNAKLVITYLRQLHERGEK